MKIKIACCLLVITFNFCTKENKIQQAAKNKDLYLIDLDNIKKEETVSASSFFDSAELIFLETNDECLIGEISDVQFLDDKLLILDERVTKSLFVYKIDGTFLYKISRIGQGPGEYVSLSDFTINTDKREIYLLDDENEHILKFNMDNGNYIATIKLEVGDYCRNIQYNNGRLYADANDGHVGSLLNEINIETGEKIKKWLDTDLYNKGWMGLFFVSDRHFYSRNSSQNMYNQIFMDTVISIENSTIKSFLAVKSKDWMVKEELSESMKNDFSELSNYLFTNNKIYGIKNIFEYENHIYFNFNIGRSLNSILFNKEDRTSIMFQSFEIDLLYENENIYTSGFITSDSDGLYCVFPAEYLKEMEKSPKPAVLKEYLRDKYAERISAIKEDDNPVLIYLKNTKHNTR